MKAFRKVRMLKIHFSSANIQHSALFTVGRLRPDRFPRRLSTMDVEYASLPGRQVSRLHVEDPFLPRNLNCVLSPENED